MIKYPAALPNLPHPAALQRGLRWAFLLALAWLFLASGTVWACPGCKDALTVNGDGGDLVSGYFWSILFMMSMPFMLVGSFGGAMYLAVRRARAEQANAGLSTDGARANFPAARRTANSHASVAPGPNSDWVEA